jgi:hypothetical protein
MDSPDEMAQLEWAGLTAPVNFTGEAVGRERENRRPELPEGRSPFHSLRMQGVNGGFHTV